MEIFRNWRIIAACCLGVGAGTTGIPFYTMGFFIDPLATNFDWGRGQIQLWLTVLLLSTMVFVPIAGWLTDKVGVRRVALPSLLGVGVVFAGIGYLTHSLTSYYAGAVLLAAAGAGTSPVTWTRAINGWFSKQRGIALGLALAGTGLAAFLAPLYLSWVMSIADWRMGYVALGLMPIAVFPVVFFLLQDPPQASTANASNPIAIGKTLPQALSDYRFWLIGIAFFAVSAAVSGSISNLVPLMLDGGLTGARAGEIAGLVGLSVLAGRMIAGFLMDRFWAPAVAALMVGAPAIATILFSQPVLPVDWLPLAAVLLGLAAGAEFDFIAFLTSRYFGLAHYGKIYALQYSIFVAGAALSPPLFGYAYDTSGSYSQAFTISAGLFLFGALLLLFLGRYPTDNESVAIPDGSPPT